MLLNEHAFWFYWVPLGILLTLTLGVLAVSATLRAIHKAFTDWIEGGGK